MDQLLKQHYDLIDKDTFLRQWVVPEDNRDFRFFNPTLKTKGQNSELLLHIKCKYKELLKAVLEKIASDSMKRCHFENYNSGMIGVTRAIVDDIMNIMKKL